MKPHFSGVPRSKVGGKSNEAEFSSPEWSKVGRKSNNVGDDERHDGTLGLVCLRATVNLSGQPF
jgi:hypothetical protein